MSRRIYLASSWRNPEQPAWVRTLRNHGHQVYDFRNPAPGDAGFHWSDIDPDWQGWTVDEYLRQLATHPVAQAGYAVDKRALDWADTGVLLLPCGKSAHLEAGYLTGQGKPVAAVVRPGGFEPELMYLLMGARFANAAALLAWLAFLAEG